MKSAAWSQGLLLRLLPIALILGAMVLALAMGWHHAFTLENIVAVRDRFHHFLAQHAVLSVLAYFLIYATAASLSLPGSLALTLTGGLLFGTLIGGCAALLAATLGATLVFLIARLAIADANLTDLASKLAWVPSIGGHVEKVRKLDALLGQMRAGFKKNAMSYLLFLRLVPAFPFWVVNLVAAILGVPLRTYVIGTFFGIIPATFAFASLGAGLDSVIVAAKADHMACVATHGTSQCKLGLHASSLVTRELILAFVLLGLAALVPVAYKKWRSSNAE